MQSVDRPEAPSVSRFKSTKIQYCMIIEHIQTGAKNKHSDLLNLSIIPPPQKKKKIFGKKRFRAKKKIQTWHGGGQIDLWPRENKSLEQQQEQIQRLNIFSTIKQMWTL